MGLGASATGAAERPLPDGFLYSPVGDALPLVQGAAWTGYADMDLTRLREYARFRRSGLAGNLPEPQLVEGLARFDIPGVTDAQAPGPRTPSWGSGVRVSCSTSMSKVGLPLGS